MKTPQILEEDFDGMKTPQIIMEDLDDMKTPSVFKSKNRGSVSMKGDNEVKVLQDAINQ